MDVLEREKKYLWFQWQRHGKLSLQAEVAQGKVNHYEISFEKKKKNPASKLNFWPQIAKNWKSIKILSVN